MEQNLCTQEWAYPKDAKIPEWARSAGYENKRDTRSNSICRDSKLTCLLPVQNMFLFKIPHDMIASTSASGSPFFFPASEAIMENLLLWLESCAVKRWLHTWWGRLTALQCHLFGFFPPKHKLLSPFKAERFGFLVIISPSIYSTMPGISVGFLLVKFYIFYIQTDKRVSLD